MRRNILRDGTKRLRIGAMILIEGAMRLPPLK